LWSVFALAFAFISPIVALYAIFGLAFAAGGPAFWWGFAVVLAGQFLVALVFAELASRWPIEGSTYQWPRRLWGNGYGWFDVTFPSFLRAQRSRLAVLEKGRLYDPSNL
jgi:amino acid transporter